MYPDDRMFIQVTGQLNTDPGLFHRPGKPPSLVQSMWITFKNMCDLSYSQT